MNVYQSRSVFSGERKTESKTLTDAGIATQELIISQFINVIAKLFLESFLFVASLILL